MSANIYTPRKQQRLIFDLETAANPENLALMPEPKAPGNLKDPVKIGAAIAEKKAELIETAALDPDYGKILSIGFSLDGENILVMMVGDCYFAEERVNPETKELYWYEERATEQGIIETFWQHFLDCHGCCIGFNILSFDLPYLMARSLYLGIRVPLIPNLAKFRTDPVTDLYAIRYNWGPGKGLKQVCKLLGIPNDCPDIDGSKVKDLTREQLHAYQFSDVKLTIDLYRRMNGVYFYH